MRDSFRFENLLALSRHGRSVRWFLPKPVPRGLVAKAMLVAREALSARNRQPFVFRAFDRPERARDLAVNPMGAAGYAHQIPLLTVVVGQQRSFFDARDAGKMIAMRETVQLEPDERPVSLVAGGYPVPKAEVARSHKRPVSELLKFE